MAEDRAICFITKSRNAPHRHLRHTYFVVRDCPRFESSDLLLRTTSWQCVCRNDTCRVNSGTQTSVAGYRSGQFQSLPTSQSAKVRLIGTPLTPVALSERAVPDCTFEWTGRLISYLQSTWTLISANSAEGAISTMHGDRRANDEISKVS